jgi:pyridoxal 5'-phosphate synthase pdxS subunit
MALERVPADIRADGGVARMSDPEKIVEIQEAVTIPVMAKARIGHFVEAQILEAFGSRLHRRVRGPHPADEAHHIDKGVFDVPFVCGATNLGEALRRIGEGAAMIRSKGEAGTGNVVEAVRHMRAIVGGIRRLSVLDHEELMTEAKNLQAPYELVRWVAENGRLPVVLFTAGGLATPADAALMMQLGADGVFVGSGIFKSGDPGAAGEGHRQGDHALQGREGRGRGQPRSGRGHGRPGDGGPFGGGAASYPWLVTERRTARRAWRTVREDRGPRASGRLPGARGDPAGARRRARRGAERSRT